MQPDERCVEDLECLFDGGREGFALGDHGHGTDAEAIEQRDQHGQGDPEGGAGFVRLGFFHGRSLPEWRAQDKTGLAG